MNPHASISAAKAAIPLALIAQAELGAGWTNALLNYGALGLWVIYLVVRDYRDSEKRDRQHEANIVALQNVRDALRDTINLVVVGMSAMKKMDADFSSLAERLKSSNGDHHHQ